MPVTITSQRLDPQTYKCTAAGMAEGATLYWYINGKFLEASTRTSIVVTAPAEERTAVFVSDDVNEAPPLAYPGNVFLTWYLSDNAAVFRVDKWVTDEWVEQARIPVSPLQYIYQWVSPRLDDVTTHLYRVVPITSAGVDGYARNFSILMVRWPDTPDVTYTLDAVAATLTVEAA